jgi:hypothetical protein
VNARIRPFKNLRMVETIVLGALPLAESGFLWNLSFFWGRRFAIVGRRIPTGSRRMALGSGRKVFGSRRTALGMGRNQLVSRRNVVVVRRNAAEGRRNPLGTRRNVLGERRNVQSAVQSCILCLPAADALANHAQPNHIIIHQLGEIAHYSRQLFNIASLGHNGKKIRGIVQIDDA